MLPATMIALALNLPLADIDSFASGQRFSSGKTRGRRRDPGNGGEVHALVVDDSCSTGAAMRGAREKLRGVSDSCTLTYCAVYGVAGRSDLVDLTMFEVPEPRVFEWNVLHHPILHNTCVDIDGVLCHDPTEAENDDAEAYMAFLEHARPLVIPTGEIGALVTSRLERYREPTETWLKRHGVSYRTLIMLDLPDAETRRRLNGHGDFKGRYYRASGSALFIESELSQARTIAAVSGKPVLCLQGPVMCLPNALAPIAVAQRSRRWLKSSVGRLIGPRYVKAIKRLMR